LHLSLKFHGGTLVLDSDEPDAASALSPPECRYDDRVHRWRAPAASYRAVFAWLHRSQAAGALTFTDDAREYGELGVSLDEVRTARPYQSEAVSAWADAGKRGQIVLPTGSGKSFVAQLAIEVVGRSTLVVVPTIDLMNQWYSGLLAAFEGVEVGLLGGGYHEIHPLTVTTYNSFNIHIGRYGGRFGLLVFDECHHLAGSSYLEACSAAIAPFALGLTATPERHDGRDVLLELAIGPIVYQRGITELAGEFLAAYDVERIPVDLNDEEKEFYATEREIYLNFIRSKGIRFSARGGWNDFVVLSSRSPEGRRAFTAFRQQRRVALTCASKLQLVGELIAKHAADRVIVFTNDNPTVYLLSRRLLLPCITHQTPTKERKEILERFNDGRYPAVLTSKVLNEGVDVPEANVAIVLSGSGSVREHVQRLGRILRMSKGKRALLYEVVTRNTVEEGVSERRREHDAYR
jgi:superfamily II DNA or RNA helicase